MRRAAYMLCGVSGIVSLHMMCVAACQGNTTLLLLGTVLVCSTLPVVLTRCSRSMLYVTPLALGIVLVYGCGTPSPAAAGAGSGAVGWLYIRSVGTACLLLGEDEALAFTGTVGIFAFMVIGGSQAGTAVALATTVAAGGLMMAVMAFGLLLVRRLFRAGKRNA